MSLFDDVPDSVCDIRKFRLRDNPDLSDNAILAIAQSDAHIMGIASCLGETLSLIDRMIFDEDTDEESCFALACVRGILQDRLDRVIQVLDSGWTEPVTKSIRKNARTNKEFSEIIKNF